MSKKFQHWKVDDFLHLWPLHTYKLYGKRHIYLEIVIFHHRFGYDII